MCGISCTKWVARKQSHGYGACREKVDDLVPLLISYWDAAIVSAAAALGATTLYSEDLNSGQRFDGARVVNPFEDI